MKSSRFLKSKTIPVLVAVLISTFLIGKTDAQSGTTSIGGTVFDRQRQVIFGATVTLSNAEKGFIRNVITGDNGTFIFPAIQPGVYRIEVEMNGFKNFVKDEIRASVDTPVEVYAVLEIGSFNEIVNVRSDTSKSLLNSQDASVGNVFTVSQLVQLPTESREVINLLTLQPGVTPAGYVVGGRSDQANIMLDGVDINDRAVFPDNIFSFNRNSAVTRRGVQSGNPIIEA